MTDKTRKSEPSKLRILVIDDNPIHLKAAQQTLGHHELTLCQSQDELDDKEYLLPGHYKRDGGHEIDRHDYSFFDDLFPFDVVLCDLLMPAGKKAQGPKGKHLIDQEMPIGWAFALQAASRGAKYVAVVTDTNHHDHPGSALLDTLSWHILTINRATALFTNLCPRVGIIGTEVTCTRCAGATKLDDDQLQCHKCKGIGINYSEEGKDWGKILERLMKSRTFEK